MARVGALKTCRARVSATNKKKCDTQFVVNHKKQKFCSNKCRNRNNRITKSDERKKELKRERVSERKREVIDAISTKAEKALVVIKTLYDQIDSYSNVPLPKLKDQSTWEERRRHEDLLNEIEKKKAQGAYIIPQIKSKLQRESSNIGFVLFSKWVNTKNEEDKKQIGAIIDHVRDVLGSSYYSSVPMVKESLEESIKDYIFYVNTESDFYSELDSIGGQS